MLRPLHDGVGNGRRSFLILPYVIVCISLIFLDRIDDHGRCEGGSAPVEFFKNGFDGIDNEIPLLIIEHVHLLSQDQFELLPTKAGKSSATIDIAVPGAVSVVAAARLSRDIPDQGTGYATHGRTNCGAANIACRYAADDGTGGSTDSGPSFRRRTSRQ
uniref:Uncharacterized protein n=1 Tax=Rhizobium leguminosarum TaxID=384 RepID=A0A179BAK8_RHILE|nr:hypothetical protein A4U53_35265 [Rhizobium leguminosarum]